LWKIAEAAAAGASELLLKAKVFAKLEEAVADLHFLWATTARERGQHKRILTPAEAMPEMALALAAGDLHGVLFGPERTGMTNDEIAMADAILTFPVNPAYASLNLAQAVLLTAYEWLKASSSAEAPFAHVDRSPPAPRDMVLSFFDYLEGELERCGFFRPLGKQPVMRRNLRNIFHRMQMSEQDVRTLRGAIVRLVEGPRCSQSLQDQEAAAGAEEGAEDKG
jgi:tRNA/rRNA methyltransferase